MLATVNDYIDAGLTHSVHTSERKSFRGCRRRWNWISREFYYPYITARPLEFGVAFHGAMEEYYKSYLGLFQNPDPAASLAMAIATFKRVVKEQRAKFVLNNNGIDPEMAADYDDRVDLGVKMLNYYFTQVAPKQHEGLKPLKVEIKFEVPIKNPDTGEQDLWCKCDHCWKRWIAFEADEKQKYIFDDFRQRGPWKGLPVTFGGRIDILFEDNEGRIWIGDWKTASRLSGTETSDEYLWTDDQISGYVAALRLIGIPVVGFIYAEIKKAVPEEPEPMKHRRLGRLFSISRSLLTDATLYENTVRENDPGVYEEGRYDGFIQYLKESGPEYHRWHPVFRNDAQCAQALRNLWMEAKEMTSPDLLIYPNFGRFHCQGSGAYSGCAFFEPCLGKERGEDYQYGLDTGFQKLDRHYWEDAEPTTDKRMEKV